MLPPPGTKGAARNPSPQPGTPAPPPPLRCGMRSFKNFFIDLRKGQRKSRNQKPSTRAGFYTAPFLYNPQKVQILLIKLRATVRLLTDAIKIFHWKREPKNIFPQVS
jgi:hypothetical protein